jgi:GNAT superfamily N-acetyltransferase
MDEFVRRWQRGWGVCRGLSPAQPVRRNGILSGLAVEIGLPGRPREIFTLSDEPELVRELTAGAAPETWVTVPTIDREDEVAGQLAGLGFDVFDERKALMTIALADQPDAAPGPEYQVELAEDNGVLRVQVLHRSGEVAARGMAAVVGEDVVMHDIHTDPEHRRRGLGTVVMAALGRRAIELGASTGLLMATYEGVQLYTRLGWLLRATMVTGSGLGATGSEGGDLRPVLASR